MTIVDEVKRTLTRWRPPGGKATAGFPPVPEGYWYSGGGSRPGWIPWFSGFSEDDALGDLSPAQMYATQPYLRIVVDFLARNVAQLGLHLFDRVSDDSRVRITDGPVFATLNRPNPDTTQYELICALISDMALYDRGLWLLAKNADTAYPWQLRQIPVPWATPVDGDRYSPSSWRIVTGNGGTVEVPAADMLDFHGWAPGMADRGLSPVTTLKLILAEQREAHRFRLQVWSKAGRVGSFLTRPATAPPWSETASERFKDDWRESYSGDGLKAGTTPILEDGMEIKRVGFSAHEDEYVDASKLALTTVAGAYHVNPTMIGLLDNANYSNVREFRRMLYGDTLGPILAQVEDRINTFLLPKLGAPPTYYVEFNIAEKLQGSFEEQAAVMSTLVGAPVMTANEGRARFNLPRMTGGLADELVVPLNVTTGGQASPQDGKTAAVTLLERLTGVPAVDAKMTALGDRIKAASAGDDDEGGVYVPPADDKSAALLTAVLARFFTRQRGAVLSLIGAGSGAWWDADRWDAELDDDLTEPSMATVGRIGPLAAAGLGFAASAFDLDRTRPFIGSVTATRARWINQATHDQLSDVLNNTADEVDKALAAVFEEAATSRAAQSGQTLSTTLVGFSANEAAHQLDPKASKTWIVTSRNPRKAHKKMHGETVGVGRKFSNRAQWPGDPVLGVDGVAGCTCTIQITAAGKD